LLAVAAGLATIEELEVLDDDAHLGAFAAVLGLPLVEFQAAFDEEGVAFFLVLGEDFGSFAVAGAIDESGFFFFDAVLPSPSAVDGQAELADLGLGGGDDGDLGVARHVADEHDFVEVGHKASV
jgi:catechol 2,3-dioxygenase-like lactoylglutathione lyase family enzyme